MVPEKGDPNIHVTVTDVCTAFRAVGVKSADTVLYHGSLSSMGTVDGGPRTVIDGVLAAVGPEGTVAMPTLWFHDADPPLDPGMFDVATSPAYIGALAEGFRQDPRSIRSNHFSHSVSAIGARAAALTTNHGAAGCYHTPWGPRAFADVSPWGRLYDWDAMYCFIGVTLRVCTMKHYIEARIVDECLQHAPASARDTLRGQLSRIGFHGIWPYFDSKNLAKVSLPKDVSRPPHWARQRCAASAPAPWWTKRSTGCGASPNTGSTPNSSPGARPA